MFVLVPLFVRALGGTELTIGLVLGVGTAASVATRPLVGMLLDTAGRRPVLLAAGVANVLSWLPFLGLRSVGPWLYVWATLHSIVWGALFAAYFTYAADLTPPARRGGCFPAGRPPRIQCVPEREPLSAARGGPGRGRSRTTLGRPRCGRKAGRS